LIQELTLAAEEGQKWAQPVIDYLLEMKASEAVGLVFQDRFPYFVAFSNIPAE
jgi:hypothetical protein